MRRDEKEKDFERGRASVYKRARDREKEMEAWRGKKRKYTGERETERTRGEGKEERRRVMVISSPLFFFYLCAEAIERTRGPRGELSLCALRPAATANCTRRALKYSPTPTSRRRFTFLCRAAGPFSAQYTSIRARSLFISRERSFFRLSFDSPAFFSSPKRLRDSRVKGLCKRR